MGFNSMPYIEAPIGKFSGKTNENNCKDSVWMDACMVYGCVGNRFSKFYVKRIGSLTEMLFCAYCACI